CRQPDRQFVGAAAPRGVWMSTTRAKTQQVGDPTYPFSILCSPFSVLHSLFSILCSPFAVRRSPLRFAQGDSPLTELQTPRNPRPPSSHSSSAGSPAPESS